MKETEFAKLLGDLPENYILQAQAHRSGGRYAVGARRPVLKFAAVAAAAALMLGGFFWALEKQTREPTAQQAAPTQAKETLWQMEIVNSKRSFQSDTYGSDLTIEEYTQRLQEEDPDCAPRAYVKIDLDQDGQEELAIRFERDKKHVLTLIFWQDGDGIYGAEYTRQDMSFLKEDGTFYYLQSVPDDSYFSDALFIGDSRTDGFRDYSSLKDVASFWAKESLSVYNVLDKSLPLYTHGTWEDSQTLQQVLETHPYGKIYVSMGINEIGMPTTVKYVEKYKALLEMIREAEPDAILYIQGNMHVSKAFSSSDPVTNNVNLVERNAAIATLANGRDIFYLDMNPAVCDENGDLREELTGDGVHLKASAYEKWADFLRQNAIVK